MSIAAMAYIGNRMKELGIPYAFLRWNKDPSSEYDYYFTGEYTEIETPTKEENGMQETTVFLRGFTWKDALLLEEAKEKIESGLPVTTILENGNGLAIFYDFAQVVPTSVDNFKSIKINLTVQEWKV